MHNVRIFSYWVETIAEKKNGRFNYLEVGRLEGISSRFPIALLILQEDRLYG
jgi:hypothetical protein